PTISVEHFCSLAQIRSMDLHEVEKLLSARPAGEHTYAEILRKETLSVGLSVWPAGDVDGQKPHNEDEVYFVVRGRGKIRVADEQREVGAGALVFVGAQVPHHFCAIVETLHVLVCWAPPHHS